MLNRKITNIFFRKLKIFLVYFLVFSLFAFYFTNSALAVNYTSGITKVFTTPPHVTGLRERPDGNQRDYDPEAEMKDLIQKNNNFMPTFQISAEKNTTVAQDDYKIFIQITDPPFLSDGSKKFLVKFFDGTHKNEFYDVFEMKIADNYVLKSNTKEETINFPAAGKGKIGVSDRLYNDSTKDTVLEFSLTTTYYSVYPNGRGWDASEDFNMNKPYTNTVTQKIKFSDLVNASSNSDECNQWADQIKNELHTAFANLKLLQDEYQILEKAKYKDQSKYWNEASMSYDINLMGGVEIKQNGQIVADWKAALNSAFKPDGLKLFNDAKTSITKANELLTKMKNHIPPCTNTIQTPSFVNPDEYTPKSIDDVSLILKKLDKVSESLEAQQQTGKGQCAADCTKKVGTDAVQGFFCQAACWISEAFAGLVNFGLEMFKGALSTESTTEYTPFANVKIQGGSGSASDAASGTDSAGNTGTTNGSNNSSGGPTIHEGDIPGLPSATPEPPPIEEIPLE